MFAPKFKAIAPQGTGIWTPKLQTPCTSLSDLDKHQPSVIQPNQNTVSTTVTSQASIPQPPPIPSLPIWSRLSQSYTPKKEFRPVRFQSPTLQQRYVLNHNSGTVAPLPPWSTPYNLRDIYALPQTPSSTHSLPPLTPRSTSYTNISPATTNAASFYYGYNDTAASVPNITSNSNVSDKIKTFERSASATELIRPFQRRYRDHYNHPAVYKPNEVIYKVKHEYMSEPESENELPRKMAQLGRHQYDGIGPVTSDGMPINLRSEVKEPHQHEWYKRLYQTIHKQKNNDDYVIRYKSRRGPSNYKSAGYLSEPDQNYDSDFSIKYRTLDRRRVQPDCSTTSVKSDTSYPENISYGTMPNPIKAGQAAYKNQPGRIENYITGQSSVSEKEKKENFEQAKLSPHYTEGNLSRALAKESGYTSDSNLVFRKRELPQQSPLSPVQQKEAYKYLQAGGEPPLLGFRKPAPLKTKEPPNNRYYESDVNIHFKTPVRNEYKPPLSEEELAICQTEHMQKLYQEERRRKYLQELQDMNARRHTDNFTPSQKSPIALNRYDDFQSDLAPKSPNIIYPKLAARALYAFQGQSARELSFRKGDIVYIRRQVDKNWYEGEYNAMIGLLPVTYVEILNREGVRQPSKKPSEGQARAKFHFQAQSGVELSLNKGELVMLTRRVDDNWFEGKIANRKGIFPVTYVEVLTDIGAEDLAAKTVISEQSTINLRPTLDTLRTNITNELNQITRNGHHPPNGILKSARNLQKTDVLHVDTSVVPLTYRALYKYRPQNSDELELLEGDVVQVLEQCDDGWFVGSSQRTGCFGTFPGNYVERV